MNCLIPETKEIYSTSAHEGSEPENAGAKSPLIPRISSVEVIQNFRKSAAYMVARCLKYEEQFTEDFIQRFDVMKYEARGTDKVVFRDAMNHIIKVIFNPGKLCRWQLTVHKSMLELEFLLKHKSISNPPKNITIHLNKNEREEFFQKFNLCIQEHSMNILDLSEPNFGGILTWREESYLYSALELEPYKNQLTPEERLAKIELLIDFWGTIKTNIASGTQYMVKDLGPVNIGIFADSTVRIIDARPSDTPLSAKEVEDNIQKYIALRSKILTKSSLRF